MSERSAVREGVVGVILDTEGRFLVIERSQFVRAPGKLCFPGGGVEPGETQQEAVIRELQEELALVVRPIRKVWENQTRSGIVLHWWRVEVESTQPPRPSPEEVASYSWLRLRAFQAMPNALETNLDFLKALDAGEIQLS